MGRLSRCSGACRASPDRSCCSSGGPGGFEPHPPSQRKRGAGPKWAGSHAVQGLVGLRPTAAAVHQVGRVGSSPTPPSQRKRGAGPKWAGSHAVQGLVGLRPTAAAVHQVGRVGSSPTPRASASVEPVRNGPALTLFRGLSGFARPQLLFIRWAGWVRAPPPEPAQAWSRSERAGSRAVQGLVGLRPTAAAVHQVGRVGSAAELERCA